MVSSGASVVSVDEDHVRKIFGLTGSSPIDRRSAEAHDLHGVEIVGVGADRDPLTGVCVMPVEVLPVVEVVARVGPDRPRDMRAAIERRRFHDV